MILNGVLDNEQSYNMLITHFVCAIFDDWNLQILVIIEKCHMHSNHASQDESIADVILFIAWSIMTHDSSWPRQL